MLLAGAPAPAAGQGVKKEMAKRHFKNGAAYYDQANYSAALSEFTKAYELASAPELKFNIGRCYEGLGRLEEAIAAYKQYLQAAPETGDRTSIELRIKNLEKRLEATRPPPSPPPPGPEPTGGDAAAPKATGGGGADGGGTDGGGTDGASPVISERPARPGSTRRLIGWTAVGVGAAALITAGILGGLALSKTGAYEDAHANHELYADARGLLEAAEGLETGSFVALGVGIAAAAGGVILLLLDGGSSETGDDESDDLATGPRGPAPGAVRLTATGLRLHF
jgi:tetratricopeptide (TPR) repeat protein